MSGIPKAKLVPPAALDDMVSDGAGFAGFAAGDVGQGRARPRPGMHPDMRAMILAALAQEHRLGAWNAPGRRASPRNSVRAESSLVSLRLARQRGYELMVGDGAGVHAVEAQRRMEPAFPGTQWIMRPSPVTICARCTVTSTSDQAIKLHAGAGMGAVRSRPRGCQLPV